MFKRPFFFLLTFLLLSNLQIKAAPGKGEEVKPDRWWLGIHSGFRYDLIRMLTTIDSYGVPITWKSMKPGKNMDLEAFVGRNLNNYFSLKAGVTYSRKACMVEASQHLMYTSLYNLYHFEFRYGMVGLALQSEGVLMPGKRVSPFFVTGVKHQWKVSENYLQLNNDHTSTEEPWFSTGDNAKSFWTVPAEFGVQYRYNAQLGIKLSAVYEQYWNTPVFLITNLVTVGAFFKLNYYFGHPQQQLSNEEIIDTP